jgi:hypothetical protein
MANVEDPSMVSDKLVQQCWSQTMKTSTSWSWDTREYEDEYESMSRCKRVWESAKRSTSWSWYTREYEDEDQYELKSRHERVRESIESKEVLYGLNCIGQFNHC